MTPSTLVLGTQKNRMSRRDLQNLLFSNAQKVLAKFGYGCGFS